MTHLTASVGARFRFCASAEAGATLRGRRPWERDWERRVSCGELLKNLKALAHLITTTGDGSPRPASFGLSNRSPAADDFTQYGSDNRFHLGLQPQLEPAVTARTRRRVAVTIAAILSTVAVAITGCGPHSSSISSTTSTSQRGNQVNVVAAENFWGDITRQIGGDHVNVTSVISDPNADPHLYESDAQTAAAVSTAELVIVNGLGYDEFMDKLLSASPNQHRKVLTAADVMQISGPDANPHIWYDIGKLPGVALAIAAQLAALAPGDAATFTANAKTFGDSLAPINAAIASIKTKHPGAPVAYTERVPGYFVDAAGLRLAIPTSFARAIEDGNDPSLADNAAMDTAVSTRAIKVLLYNEQTNSPAVNALKSLAQQSGVPIVGVTETLPPAASNFQQWQLGQVNQIAQALGH